MGCREGLEMGFVATFFSIGILSLIGSGLQAAEPTDGAKLPKSIVCDPAASGEMIDVFLQPYPRTEALRSLKNKSRQAFAAACGNSAIVTSGELREAIEETCKRNARDCSADLVRSCLAYCADSYNLYDLVQASYARGVDSKCSGGPSAPTGPAAAVQ